MSNAILRSQESGTDRNGERIATQTWYVPLRPGDAARVYLADNDNVDYDSPFPGDPVLIADSIIDSASVDGVGTEINVKYSTSGRFTFFQDPNKQLRDYIRYTRTWQVVKRQIPVSVKKRYTFPNPSAVKGDPAPEVIDAWVLQWIFGGHEKQEVVEIEVEFEVINNQFSTINKIGDQQNNIHKFATLGALYRFEAGPVRHVSATTFQCKYSWIGDLGTPRSESMIAADALLNIAFPPEVSPGLIRKPHHEFYTIPSLDPLIAAHQVGNVSAYNFRDQEGWKSLPGIPQSL